MGVLVDADALIALLNRNDTYHERISDFGVYRLKGNRAFQILP